MIYQLNVFSFLSQLTHLPKVFSLYFLAAFGSLDGTTVGLGVSGTSLICCFGYLAYDEWLVYRARGGCRLLNTQTAIPQTVLLHRRQQFSKGPYQWEVLT